MEQDGRRETNWTCRGINPFFARAVTLMKLLSSKEFAQEREGTCAIYVGKPLHKNQTLTGTREPTWEIKNTTALNVGKALTGKPALSDTRDSILVRSLILAQIVGRALVGVQT